MSDKIKTFWMFDGKAEVAMNFHVSLFNNSRMLHINHYKATEAGKEGAVMHEVFMLNGQVYTCLDSPVEHDVTFTSSISLHVDCDSESESDRLFGELSQGGQILMPLDSYPYSEKYG